MAKTLTKKAETKNGLHFTRNNLNSKSREALTAMLNQSLADTLDLASQVKQAHWNVKGPHFYQLHLLFDEIAGELYGYGDEIAERVTSLGGTAMGTARMAAKNSQLPELANVFDGQEVLEALAERFAAYGAGVRECIERSDDYGDADSADLYTVISRAADKRLWFIEAHLQA